MGKPDLAWPEPQAVVAAVQPPGRLARWLAASLVLLMLAFVFHTRGFAAQAIQHQTRHWMTVTTPVPRFLKHPPIATLRGLEASKAPGAIPARRSARWLAPVTGARLIKSFGWHGRGSRARFQSDVEIRVATGVSVIAGVKAHVIRLTKDGVVVTSDGYHIKFQAVAPEAGIKANRAVSPTTRLGRAVSAILTLTVTRDGYPVNPLLPTLYGSGWLRL
ncbi:MAG: hypothetical protein M0Z36_11335 [Thermaerobacter sp.]|nr:hypothetical protein [Thermaerobacter sp.]